MTTKIEEDKDIGTEFAEEQLGAFDKLFRVPSGRPRQYPPATNGFFGCSRQFTCNIDPGRGAESAPPPEPPIVVSSFQQAEAN